MHGARRFLAHESRSKYTIFLRKWQGYSKKTAYFWLIIFFFVYLHPFFFSEKNHLYLYIIRYAREKWVNMAWYLHEKELGLNNKEQDIFMDKKIKALFFDIDGTLVSFKSHRIPQSTVDALEQAKENGVEVYISTGRPKQIINNLGQIEHLIDGYITANGARCFVEDTLVSQHAILPSDVKKIIEAADRDNYPAIVVSESRFAIHHYTDEVYEIFCKGLGVDSSIFITDVNDLGEEPILQVTPFCTVEQEALLMPTLENCTSGRWHPAFTDITARGADKGKGLHAMADYLGLNIEETMAFGDGGNDISIIKEAGVGVAMGNAGEDLKQVADFITTHVDEDGVKNALIKYGVIAEN